MKALIAAELLKLRTRTTAGLLLATFALVALTSTVSIPKVGAENAPVPLDDPGLLASTVGSSFGVPEVLIVLLGSLAFTQEFRYGTVTSTYLGEPRRARILAAKWVSLAMTSVVVTVGTLLLAVAVSLVIIEARNGNITLGAQCWQTVVAAFAIMAAYAVIGVALGALIRNQVATVVAVLVWMLAVEYILIPAWPVVGQWLPLGVITSLLQLGPSLSLDGKLLPASIAALVLVLYTVAAVVAALRITPRRDVL
jgi:ABC-2 type transport system permease protein